MASAWPVFPEVGSTMVPPGFSRPRRSASSIMRSPIRSLTLPPGLSVSTFARMVGRSPAVMRWSRTNGVCPTASRMLPRTCTGPHCMRRIGLSSEEGGAVPVSVANSQVVYDAMRGVGVTLVSALPETWLVHLIRLADSDPEMTLVRLAKEEEGVGISIGAHLAGVKSAMLMQNHGFLAAINGIVSGAQLYRVPLVMLISDRGTFGERDPW